MAAMPPCPACGRAIGDGAPTCAVCLDADVAAAATLAGAGAGRDARFAGRYDVKRLLGRGATKEVFLARDVELERDVALSLIAVARASPAARERWRREARLMARLGAHPHVVTIYDAGECDGVPYLVAQCMTGGSVAERLRRHPDRRLAPAQAARLCFQVAGALGYAHASGVVHRDVKPDNVWLDGDDAAALGDFGIAWTRDDAGLTGAGALVGSPTYMAPEQAAGRFGDPRSDLYALGVMLYELLCGRPPFAGAGLQELLEQHATVAPDPPSRHRGDVPAELERVVLSLLAKAPEDRPPTAAAVRGALAGLAGAELASGAAGLSAAGEPSLIGRDALLARLQAKFGDAAVGRGAIVGLAGEPGSGKTRVVEALLTHARRHGATAVSVRFAEEEGAPPCWAWSQLVRALLAEPALNDSSGSLGEVARLLAEAGTGSPHVRERFALAGAVSRLLADLSGRRPLVLALDDLDRGGEDSLALLPHVAGEAGRMAIMLVLAFRDGSLTGRHPLRATLAELAREPSWQRLRLAPLSQRDVARSIELHTGRAPDSALAAEVHGRTDGNPFLVAELARWLGGEAGTADPIGSVRAALPVGVQEAVGRGMARLGVAAAELLRVAAAANGEFDVELVARVAGCSVEAALDAVEEALAAQLVVERPQPGRFAFAHAIVRDAVWADVPRSRREEWRARTRRLSTVSAPTGMETGWIPLPNALARPSNEPFVGRDAELARLSAGWVRTLRGRATFMVVRGEPGMGKTRLAGALAARASAGPSATVLYGRCEPETVVTYQPFTEALRVLSAHAPALRFDPEFSAELATLRRLVPELGLHGVPDRPGADPSRLNRYRLFETVARLLAQAAAGGLMLVLDDLHWADRSTVLMLKHVWHRVEDLPVLVLVTLRQVKHPVEELGDLFEEAAADELVLHGLDERATAVLAGGGAATSPSPGFARRLRAMTGGNPFFMEEILRNIRGRQSEEELVRLDVPPRVRAMIGRRFRQFSDQATEILRTAAIAGQEIRLDVLRECFGAEEAIAAVEEAAEAELVVEAGDRRDRFAFAHALVRETLSSELTRAGRVRAHYRIATALEALRERQPVDVRELAQHWFEAREPAGAEKAVAHAMDAAEQATAALAHEEAAAHYERVLDCLPEERAEAAQRCELMLRVAEARNRAAQIELSRDWFARAAALAQERDWPAELSRAALGFATWRRYDVVDDQAIALLEDALERVPEHETSTCAKLLAALARHLDGAASQDRREWLLGDALKRARRSEPETLSVVLSQVPVILCRPHSAHERLAAATDGLELATAAGHREAAAFAHGYRLLALLELGRGDEVDRGLEAYAAFAGDLHRPWFEWHALVLRAMRCTLVGNFSEGERLVALARELERRYDPGSPETGAFQRIMLAKARGRPDEEHVEAAAACAEKHPSRAIWAATRAELLASLGHDAAALREVERLAEHGFDALPLDEEWLTTMAMLAETCGVLGREAEAGRLYPLLEPLAGQHVVSERGAACWGSVSRYLALLAMTTGRHDLAERHFEAALGENRRLGALPWVVHTSLGYAELLNHRGSAGDAARAASLLKTAQETAQRLGMHGLQRVVA